MEATNHCNETKAPKLLGNISINHGRVVVLHNNEGMGDFPGRIVGVAPDGCLVRCEDGSIRGADWSHIDLNIGPEDGGLQAEPGTRAGVAPLACAVPVVAGQYVWSDHEERGASEHCEVKQVEPTHLVVVDDKGEEHEVGFTDVKLDATAAAAVSDRTNTQVATTAKTTKTVGINFPVKIGDTITGCTDPNDDWISGEVLSVHEHGIFIKCTDDCECKGRVYGIPFDCILLDTAKTRAGELIAV